MSGLECNEFVEMVTAFLDGALDAQAERRFVDHLAVCTGCERYFEQFQETVRTLGELPPGHLPEDARNTLLRAFRNNPNR